MNFVSSGAGLVFFYNYSLLLVFFSCGIIRLFFSFSYYLGFSWIVRMVLVSYYFLKHTKSTLKCIDDEFYN